MFFLPTKKMIEAVIIIALVAVIVTAIVVLIWPALINVLGQIVVAF
ncbi:hypothetical protein HYU90_03415 [Candidatus Collierbacteria bacterium]|nr:hypothetical protein [Candidatus Collierbacteria bacterium]